MPMPPDIEAILSKLMASSDGGVQPASLPSQDVVTRPDVDRGNYRQHDPYNPEGYIPDMPLEEQADPTSSDFLPPESYDSFAQMLPQIMQALQGRTQMTQNDNAPGTFNSLDALVTKPGPTQDVYHGGTMRKNVIRPGQAYPPKPMNDPRSRFVR